MGMHVVVHGSPMFRGLGFRVSGVSGLRGLGFETLGFSVGSTAGLRSRYLDLRGSALKVTELRGLGLQVWV